MSLFLDHTRTNSIQGKILISGSKSESNRMLILQQFFSALKIKNLSNSDDTKHLKKALKDTSDIIDIGHAGTAMRFLTAFFASRKGKTITLTGSNRMQERPIKILVDALRDLGADITYLKNEGYPPILIKGKNLSKNKVTISGGISSQYISALLLIAPKLPNSLELTLEGQITSTPYIQMTLELLNKIGIKTSFVNQTIRVEKSQISNLKSQIFSVEPDWSSASYFFSMVALQPNSSIELIGFKNKSLQGDRVLAEIYTKLGVETKFTQKGILLINQKLTFDVKPLSLDLSNSPDLAQTIAVTCLGLGIDCHLSGLHTLKIKETDRLQALKNELEKLGATVSITHDSLHLKSPTTINTNISIQTYQDHRMAMAFAPLSVKVPICIENHDVVSKSYPNIWEDFSQLF